MVRGVVVVAVGNGASLAGAGAAGAAGAGAAGVSSPSLQYINA